MAVETSRSTTGGSADSYVGSLISLTSKYEIRYEGVLYNINTEESSIGLRNVRSFGTEGRKKDGPQVLPSDKVYEYILFRGSDIKDLQVKSSPPPVQTTPPIHNDPAIIQSHYSRPPPMPTSFPPAGSGTVPDLSSHATQMGHPRSTFQGGLPLYQPGGSLGPWGTPPPPSPSGSGLAMPMYWQGFYGPANGFPPAQQPFLRPPGLALPPSMQQPMQHPGMNLSLTTMPSNQPPSSMQPPNVSELPSPLLPPVASGALNLTSSSITPTLPSTIAAAHSAALSSETSPSLITSMTIRAPTASIPTSSLSGSLSLVSNLTTSSMDINSSVPPISDKPKTMPGPSLAYQSLSQSVSSILATSSSINPEKSTPSLVTPGQLLQRPDSAASSSSHSSQSTHKDVEVVQAPSSSKRPPSPPKEIQAPLLPLPSPLPVASDQKSGAAQQTRKTHTQSHSHNNGRNYNHSYRGRGRGRGNGYSRPITKFTEDFDFEAMNEKFNKDEVWGHLGKTNKSQLGDKAGKGEEDDGNYSNDEDEAGSLEVEVKPLYVKDDFFDSLSCNAFDRGAPNGRTKFSEQLKIDTETFGDFPRHRGGRGGRGPGRGGRSRGSYHGRGYGYVGRGRGQTHSTSGRGQTHSTSGRGHANSMSGRGN